MADLNKRLSFDGLPGLAPYHIVPAHANWNHDVEMEFQLMGERTFRAQDNEDCGMGALLDLQLKEWWKTHG